MSQNNCQRTSFLDAFHNHYCDLAVGPSYRQAVYRNFGTGYGNECVGIQRVRDTTRVEHYGTRECCAKCRKDGTMGRFDNSLNALGKLLVYGTITVLGLAGYIALLAH